MRFVRKFIYGTGDLAASLVYFSLSFFYIYYLTDGVKMDPALAGLAFLIGQVWDGVNDPLMGVLSDRTRSKFGRKRFYILLGAIPLGFSFIALWFVPTTANPLLQFTYATVSILLYTTAYTVVYIPYIALVPLMSDDYDQRTSIVSIRSVLSTVGTIAGAAVAIFISSEDGEIDMGTLHLVVITFGIISSIIYLWVAQNAKDVKEKDDPIGGQSLRSYWQVLGDHNVKTLLSVKLLGAVATGSLVATMPYYAEYILGDEGYSTLGLGLYIVVSALFIPFYSHLTVTHDKRKLLLTTNVAVAVVLLFLGFVINSALTSLFYLGTALLGVFMASYLLIPYSLVPDLVDYYEYQHGERHESVFFSLWTATHSIGIGISGIVIGAVLKMTRYDGNSQTQLGSAILGIRILFGLIPAIFLVITALVLQSYTIDKSTYAKFKEGTTKT